MKPKLTVEMQMHRRIVLAITLVVVVGAVPGCEKDVAQEPEEAIETPDAGPPEVSLGGIAATTVIWAENMGDSAAYDSVTGSVYNMGCLDPAGDTDWALDSSQFKQVTTFELIEDKMSLYEKLDIGYSTSLNAKYYKNSAEFHMTNEFQMDTHSVWALMRVAIQGPTLKRRQVKMNSHYYAKQFPGLVSFRQDCGDQFLYRIQTGANYYALLRITVKNLQEKNDLRANIKNSAGGGGINFRTEKEFESQFNMSSGSTHISSYVFKTGAITPHVVSDLSTLMEDSESWLKQVAGDFQCTATSGDAWSGAFSCPDWQTHLSDLRTRYAMKGDFLPYTATGVDWGELPSVERPDLPSGIAQLGALGASYGRHLTVLDALGSVLNAPEFYLTSRAPLTLFGRADATQSFPFITRPATLPYQIADPAQVAAAREMAQKVTTSLERLRFIAKVCTQDDSSSAPPLTIDQLCSEACQIPELGGFFGGTEAACVTACQATRMCDVAYAYYGQDPAGGQLEIKADLFGRAEGLPGHFLYRPSSGTDWREFDLPTQRERTPLTCADYQAEIWGGVLPDGEYLVYFAGSPDQPFYVYCDGMDGPSPREYLTLQHTSPEALLGQAPLDPRDEPALANYSQCTTKTGFGTRHYQKMRLFQTEGQVFLRTDLKYSAAHGTCEGFLHPLDRDNPRGSRMDIDLRGLPLELSHSQQFLAGGKANGMAPIYIWGINRIALGSDPVPRHANRVVQRLGLFITGMEAQAYPIDYTVAEVDQSLNDGKHNLALNYAPGNLRLSYVDAKTQQTLKDRVDQVEWKEWWTHIATSTAGAYQITSFEHVPLP